MINRMDVRTIGDLLSDNNTRVTPSDVLTSTLLNTLLLAASGYVELATYAGNRYTVQDLQSLPDPSGQLEVLKDLVCARCMKKLMERRPHVLAKAPDWVAEALVLLNQLRQGERIFGFLQSASAGKDVCRLWDFPMVAVIATPWLGYPTEWGNPGQAGAGDYCGGGNGNGWR